MAFALMCLYLTMRSNSIILICLFFIAGCSRYGISRHNLNHLKKCRNNWQYFKLDHQIRGKILSYAKGYCGYFAIPSETIIATTTQDTIRVLELQCDGKIFARSDSVLVTPVSEPDSVGILSDDYFFCIVKRTCGGAVTKIR
jgi:hypothetical protein